MPRFSQKSFSRLSTCSEDLQILFFEVIKHRDCIILEGYRNQEDQEKAFNSGHSKLHYPDGNHNKNPSNAVDVLPYKIDWGNKERIIYFAGFVLGVAEMLYQQGRMNHKIRWGGDWNNDLDPRNERFFDGSHYELI